MRQLSPDVPDHRIIPEPENRPVIGSGNRGDFTSVTLNEIASVEFGGSVGDRNIESLKFELRVYQGKYEGVKSIFNCATLLTTVGGIRMNQTLLVSLGNEQRFIQS